MSKQRSLFYHILKAPNGKLQEEYAKLSNSNLLGSYKNIEPETLDLLKRLKNGQKY